MASKEATMRNGRIFIIAVYYFLIISMAIPTTTYSMFDSMMEGVQVINFDWEYVYVNKASANQLNCTADDLIGKKIKEQYPILIGSSTEDMFTKCLEQKIGGRDEVHFSFAKGVNMWYELRVTPIAEGMLIMMMDITDRKAIESEVRLADEKYQYLIDNMEETYATLKVIFDDNGDVEDLIFLEANIATCKLIGLTPKEIKGKHRIELFGPISEEDKKHIKQTVNTNTKQVYFTHIPEINMHFKVSMTPLEDDHITVLSMDVTDIKAKEVLLLNSERRYTEVFANMLEGYVVCKVIYEDNSMSVKDLLILEMNPSAATAMRQKPEDFIGKLRSETIAPIDDDFRQMIAKVMSAESITLERYNEKTNSWSKSHIYKIGHDHIAIMTDDITKRKQSDALLKEREEIDRELLANMNESYMILQVVTNSDGTIEDTIYKSVNDSAAREIGLSKDKIEGQSKKALLHKPLGDKYIEIVHKVLSTNQNVSYITQLPDTEKWVDVTLYPLAQKNMIAVISEDITIQKEQEKELKMFNKRLTVLIEEKTKELVEALDREKSVNKIKSEFLSMASHELKSPLASMQVCLGIIEKVTGKNKDPILNKYTKYIGDEIANMLKMINEFVSPTNRIIAGLNEGVEEVNIVSCIESVIFGLSELTKENQNIAFEHEGAKVMIINQDIVRRIFFNLLSNAVKYSNEDISVKTKLTKEKLYVSIQDKGIGIPEADQSKIFTKFFRAYNIGKIVGTGLGLNIVKTYVDMLSGTIEFHSVENEGTTFMIELPV